jgi:hypothetical protein
MMDKGPLLLPLSSRLCRYTYGGQCTFGGVLGICLNSRYLKIGRANLLRSTESIFSTTLSNERVTRLAFGQFFKLLDWFIVISHDEQVFAACYPNRISGLMSTLKHSALEGNSVTMLLALVF